MNIPEHTKRPSLFERCVENVSTVLAVWHPSYRHRLIHVGTGDVVVPALLLLLVQALDYRVLQPFAAFNVQVVQSAAGGAALALLALVVVMAILRQDTATWPTTIGVLWALVFGTIASTATLSFSDPTGLADWIGRRFGLVYVFALVFLLFRLRWRGGVLFAALILPAALMLLPWFMTLNATPEKGTAYFDPDVEMIYADQDALLSAQIDTLRRGVPGTPEVFAVLGAGYAFESVFRREVEAVGSLLSDRFKAEGRVISLVNDDEDVTTYPLMNRVNLAASLKAVATVMNPEDIALLFITSHGAPDVLSTRFNEVITRDLTPADVDKALSDAGIVNAIMILPACYSGAFAEALQSPTRLVLTGTDADSVSFGCNDQNEWTDWGRAFFVDALADTSNFRQAARLAQESVARREKAEGLPASSPQIMEGDEIGRILDAWQAELDDRL